jgi:general secretion pathway protein D
MPSTLDEATLSRSAARAPRLFAWVFAASVLVNTPVAHAQHAAASPTLKETAPPPDAPSRVLADSTDPAPKPASGLVTLSFEDANLDEVVHAMSVMTGRRFVVAATPKSFVANVVAPQKVTVLEAYQALLSVLLANHLTVVPAGPFSKIVESADAPHEAPVRDLDGEIPAEDRFITYVHRVRHVRAEEVATNVLSKLASREAQVLAFGGVLIVTDTGTNVRRMMRVLAELDVEGAEDKVWLEPLKYAISTDVKKEVDELLDLKATPAATKDRDPRRDVAGAARITRLVALDRPNALLVVGTAPGYRRLLELLRQIDVAQPSTGQMHVVMLAHAEAKKLVTALTDAVTAATSPQAGGKEQKQPLAIFDAPVKVSAEETNNALIVTASAHDFAAISDVIRSLDQPRRQVYIEALVMDLSVSNTNQLGAALHGFGDLSSSLGPGALAFGGVNPMNSIALPTDPTALQGLVLGLRGPSIPVPGFLQSVIGTSSIPGIGFLVDASTVSQDSDIVQSPSVMTTDNVPAEFHMQLNTSLQRNAPSISLPSAAGAAGATSGVAAGYTPYTAPASQNYGKIGPMLQVTPHLNESDDVRLDIEETISDLTPDPPQGTLGTVNFIERHAMTTMTVKDGSTAIIGGLVRDTVQHSATKVPLLGDIPILGFFFRSSSDVVSKANLVLVLTPHIIRDEEDMRRVVTKRMEERQQFLDHYLLFHDETGAPSLGFDPARGRGILRMIDRDMKKTEDERQLAADANAHAPAVHEERPAMGLPSAPVMDTKEPAPPAHGALRVE